MDDVRRDLEAVAASRILFGHQSVGRDVLAGMASLAQRHGIAIRVESAERGGADAAPGVFHAAIGNNGNPSSKCDAFGQLLLAGRATYDAALMKFCYVDLGRTGAASSDWLFRRYQDLVDDLEARRPDVSLVHVTIPLRAHAIGWKPALKRLIGRGAADDRCHALRHEYNEALRARYAAGNLFDLARAESTRDDGTRASCRYRGRTIDTLAHEHTVDGGHLNAEGQRRTARALLRTLAAALRRT
jgi:hypothetical protein